MCFSVAMRRTERVATSVVEKVNDEVRKSFLYIVNNFQRDTVPFDRTARYIERAGVFCRKKYIIFVDTGLGFFSIAIFSTEQTKFTFTFIK
jgi:hypothetical protein